MLRILATTFAGLFGLAFGSFLNVCVSRWPEGEGIIRPRSHCRACGRTLAWWENIPLVSWIALRGKCRTCRAPIRIRYLLVELAVGIFWALATWIDLGRIVEHGITIPTGLGAAIVVAEDLLLLWALVALAVLDAEHLWLPNGITIPGTVLGLVFAGMRLLGVYGSLSAMGAKGAGEQWLLINSIQWVAGVFIAAALVLLIRWLYWLIRRKEGMGLGDAKLMAMLAAWLGLPGALLAFILGTFLGSLAAFSLLLIPRSRRGAEAWAASKLPFGTFLCIGGIVSALWGQPILAAYMRWTGF